MKRQFSWKFSAVDVLAVFEHGIVVFLGITTLVLSPTTFQPRDSGVTSNRITSSRDRFLTPLRIAAWIAAPQATASSGLIVKFIF